MTPAQRGSRGNYAPRVGSLFNVYSVFFMYTQSYLLHFTFYSQPELSPYICKNFYARGNILEMSMMAHEARPVSQESSKNKKLE